MANYFDQFVPPPAAPTDVAPTPAAPAALATPNYFDQFVPPPEASREAAKVDGSPQMGGVEREVALPVSNAAKGLVTAVGLPGDVLRGIGYVGGQAAKAQLQGNPMPSGVTDPMPLATPASAITPEMLWAAPGKTDITPPTGHNPLDSETLTGLSRALGATDRPDLVPQTTREKIEAAAAQGAGAALPAALTAGGSVPALARSLAQGAAGGVGSDAGSDIGAYVGGAPGRVIGGLSGALLGGIMAPGGGGPGRLIPAGMDAETEALARRAGTLGIDISTGQASANPFVRFTDSTVRRLPFSGYGSFDEGQQTALNKAVSNTFGEDAPKITPQVLSNAQDRIGSTMNDIASRTSVPMDTQLFGDLANASRLAGTAGLQPGQTEAINRQIQNIHDIAGQNGGSIPGDVYQNLTKRGEALDLLQGNRSTTSGQIGGQIRDALDDALTRGAAPEDVAALQQARTQYKALKTVEPLTMRADVTGGASPSTGDISPAALLGRVNQQYPTAARQGVGAIPLKDIAQIGQRFLKEPPSSGTAERLSVQRIGEGAAGLGAAAFGGEHMGIDPLHAAGAAALGLTLPRLAGAALRSPALPPMSPLGMALAGGAPQIANGGQR